MGAGDLPDDAFEAAGELPPKRKASADAAWAALHGAKGAEASAAGAAKGKAALDILARLNRTRTGAVVKGGKTAPKAVDDREWRAMLGGRAGAGKKAPVSKEARAARLAEARAAIDKAAGVVRVVARERTDGVVKVTETRNFAGKQMEVTKTYESGSREAKAAARRDAAQSRGGLDSVLLQMEKQRKLNVLDKSKMDWKEVKASDASMEEDLEKHKKGKTYLEEQDFLKRAELREYEIERDARLAGDVRSRGRL